MTRWLKDNRGFLIFLACLGLFRTAVADWNPIPSGSMRPTILEGDVVLVNRLAYDLKVPLTDLSLARLGEPERGDVVTFTSPADGTRLIKRLVALPGDVVAMQDDVLTINGKSAHYDDMAHLTETVSPGMVLRATRATESGVGKAHAVQILQGVGSKRSFESLVVPADHYFVLGDNRNNSADSRFIGFVPRALLIGRAGHVLVSADITSNWMPRFGRMGMPL